MSSYSVIIPSHGRPELLARAIRGIRPRHGGPDAGNVTIIVVSDDQSAETCEVARACLSGNDLFIARRGAPGPARSRNLGLAVAQSDYVMFLDDDDEWPADFLTELIAAGPVAPGTLRFCDFSVAMNAGQIPRSSAPEPVSIGDRDVDQVHVRNFIPNCCLIYPLGLARSLRFDESLILNEDWDFLLAALRTVRLEHSPIQGPIVHKGRHSRVERRGASNEHLLAQVLLRIYQKWPAPTETLRAARQAMFATAGVPLPISCF